jgi:hypothetical protein
MIETANRLLGHVTDDVLIDVFAVTNAPVT